MSYLKTDKVHIESIDETLEIVQLNALGQEMFLDYHASGKSNRAIAAAVKFGTRKWRDKEVEEIMDELPGEAIAEISAKVMDLSGLGEDEKNSESILEEGSSSD